jgi:hypothetical protein
MPHHGMTPRISGTSRSAQTHVVRGAERVAANS